MKISQQLNCLIALLLLCLLYSFSFLTATSKPIEAVDSDQIWSSYYHAYQISECEEEGAVKQQLQQYSKKVIEQILSIKSASDKKIKQSIQVSTTDISTSNTQFAAVPASCPTIRVQELQGVPNFSETDQLVICGAADTLAYLIYIEEPGNISGTQLTLDFKPGMQYADFQLTHYDGTAISVVDDSPEKPRFLLDGITEGVYVAYVGVESTCAANTDAIDYTVDLKFNFIYEDTLGNFASCKQVVSPDRSYNTTIRKPVLNFRSAGNISITSLGTQRCTNIWLSQDGIKANLSEFNFAVKNLDLTGNLILNSVKANARDLSYTYDAATKTLQASPNGFHFKQNRDEITDDELFDTGERMYVQLCFQVDECPDFSSQLLTYLASYGCNGDTCEVEQADVRLSVAPTSRPEPIVTSTLSQNPSVCGNPGIINLTVTSNQPDSAIGLYQDLIVGFETCEKPSLDIAKIIIGTAPNTTEIAPENFSWVGDDLKIDFTNLTGTDPDGIGIGITDADGDGYFDDLPGGKLLNIAIELDFSCTIPTDATSLNCSNLDCSFSTFYVKAKRDCGQAFTAYPPVSEFQITNGATFVGTNQTEISNNLYGINFGATGTSGAKTKKVEFSYVYERENITPCADEFASNQLQIVYNGTPAIVQDIVLEPNSIKLNGVAVADSKATWTNVSINTRILTIDAGLNTLGDTVRYEYELTVDTTLCTPPIYMEGSHQVIETCNTGDCECQTVLACDKILFRSDPNATGCECVMRSRLVDMYRESTGYTDETMTEKVQPEDVLSADRNRYLPGDTMVYEAGYRLNTTEAFTDIYEWGMGFRILDAGFISGRSTPNLELMMDATKTELRTFEIKKAGTNNRITIDFSDIPSCLDDNISSTSVHGITMYYGTSPWEASIPSHFQRYSANSSYDYYDNSRIYIQIRNQTKLQECRNVNYSSWADNGNCWDDFNAKYQFQVGDSLFLKVGIPFTKNPHRVLANQQDEAPGTPLVYQDTWVSALDEFDSDCVVGLSTCRENVPFQTYCPSDVVAKTDLQIDDCGAMATHTFTVDNPTPINWYTEEYRPYFQMQNLDVPIYSPMMYCGNATATTKGGIDFPLTLVDTSNHTCVVVGGQSYCSVSTGNQGTFTFNPQSAGFPGLAVGLGGYRDSLKVSYDLCMICPGEIPNLDNYEIVYDYQYRGDPPNGFAYRCNFNANDLTTAEIEECAALGNGFYYYNEWMLDTLMIKSDNTSSDKTIDDQRQGFPEITQTLDRNIFSSAIPGSSEEINTIVICADSTDLSKPTHQGVMATVKLSNSVVLKNIYDENDAPLAFTYVTTDGTTSTYRTSLPNLAAGEKITIKLGTTLLFCPVAPLPPPSICVNITSGCMDPEIQAAVVGNTSACTANEVCYSYVFGAAAIQADFLRPEPGKEYPLCGDIPVAVLIKNVKKVTVTDLTAAFNLPLDGVEVVSGSFKASYPNGGDFTKPFYDIDDPVINGTQLSYTEDEVFSEAIHSNGLPGIGVLQDSNQIVIQFLMRTVCDKFVSGSKLSFRGTAADPCSVNILSTGSVVSDAAIIENANPKDFAQILTTAEPAVAYCGSTDTEFTLTGQNISQKASGDSIQICLTFPEELVYQDNSISYAIPAGKSVGDVTERLINGQTQICFAGVNNLPLGGQFTLKFKASMQEDAECGMADIGIQIKELVPDQVCVADGSLCDVFVQSSVNDAAGIELKAPIETVDIALTRSCSGGDDPVTVCFEAKLYNPGLDYTGDINIDLHDDLLSNKTLDDYDPILANQLFANQFVAAGDTVILSGCFELEELNACPVFVNIRYETDCACDYDTEYFSTIAPEFIADLPTTTVLCEGQELGIATCGEYTYTIDDAADGYMRIVGDSIYFGLTNPANEISITVEGGTGACDYLETLFLKGLEPFDPYLKDTEACINTPAYLQLVIPTKYEDEAIIKWTPSINLDDPTILDPIFTASTAGTYNYTVEITLGNDCIITKIVSVNVQSTSELSIVSEVGYCLANPPRKLTTDTGFDRYEWYILEGGFEIIQAVTTTNFWAGPSKGGLYFVKGYKTGVLCPSVSPTELIPDVKCPSLGNLVWSDTNNDGLFANEMGIENVEVTLYNLGADGQKGGGDDMLIAIDTTDENGLYLFTNLDTGSYYVVLTDGVPTGMTSSNGTGINGSDNGTYEPASDPDNDINNDDNGTDNQGVIGSAPITINLEAEPTDDGDNDNSTNLTVDFGLIPTSSIGDYVWEDTNGDGIQNDGATGIENVQVILTGIDGSGQQFTDTTYTNATGHYLFDNLLPGMYEVTFGQPNGFEFTGQNEGIGTAQDSLDSDANENGLTQTITLSLNEHNPTLDAGFYQPASLGDYVWLDTDADGIQDGEENGVENIQVILIGTDGLGNEVRDTTYTDSNGFYEFTNLVPGDYAVQFINPTDFNFSMSNLGTGISQDSLDSDANPVTGLTQTVTLVSGENNPTLDAGLFEYASLGDYAWIDTNGDGIQNEENTGIEGLKVTLTGKDNLGNVVSRMTTTLADGSYLFDNLIPGTYQVTFETPSDLNITFDNVNPNDSLDSDINEKGMTPATILVSGEHNPTLDAGYFAYASIGDYVWEDLNADGIQDEDEPVIKGVIVTLKGTDAQGNEVELQTTTNANGTYIFEKLVPGAYTVTFETPNNFEITVANQGSNDSIDSNIDLMGVSGTEILTSGEHNPTYDAGYYQLASIGDYVWEDLNANGIQDDGDSTGIEGVKVILNGTTGSGMDTMLMTVTDDKGFYVFENLIPGTYQVSIVSPGGFVITQPHTITDTEKDSNIDENGVMQPETLTSNEHNRSYDAGLYQLSSIGNYVWEDKNVDGIQNEMNTGIEGVAVNLTGKNGFGEIINLTTETDENGFYLFDNLVPGEYQVSVIPPADYFITKAIEGSNDSLDSNIDEQGIMMVEILTSGEHNLTYDAGIYKKASIGDYAWIDVNGDGLQNEEDTGIEGVKVVLTGTTAFGEVIELSVETDVNGFYIFDELTPGSYKLTFETPQMTVITFENTGTNDSLDSDINTMGMTDYEVLESGEHNPTYDAGYFMGAMLGNYTWEDLNADGIQDENEPPISGVLVTLTGMNDLGHMVELTTETDDQGFYLFPNLIPGTYTVTFTTPSGFVITQQTQGVNDSLDSNIDELGVSEMEILISGEYNPTYDAGYYQLASIGDYVWLDTNADGIQNEGDTTGLENITVNLTRLDASGIIADLSTTTDSNGYYLFDSLVPGIYQVSVITPANFEISEAIQGPNDSLDSNIDENGIMQPETLISGEHNPTYDAGIYQFASIGNYVWEDLNANGIQDETNTGIAGVTVNLTGTNANGETISLTTKTDGNGFYSFDELIPGSYQVSVVPPTDFEITPAVQGGNDSLDSNIDEQGIMMVEILTSGEQNLTYDAGLYQTASIGDYVWVDVNIDGLQNEGDSTGLANVPVFLKGVNGIGDSILLMTTTDANGAYLFDDLSPGSYQISFAVPTQYKVTLQQVGNDPLIDSNTDSLGVAMHEILTSGEHNPSYDLGLVPDFDLALIIQLAQGEHRDVVQGDTVTFNIYVENQGVADAFDIALKNYIPPGLIFDNNLNQTYQFQGNQWQGDSSLTFNQLLVGENVTIPIQLIVDTTFMDSLIINHAEIIAGSRVSGNGINAIDIDSNPDENNDDIIGGNNFLNNQYNDEDDHDFSYLVNLMEVDPLGYIYCDKTGHILKGGTISVTSPPRGVAYLAMDGSTGMYQWWTNGVEGLYTMSYTHPSGFPMSTKCLPQAGAYDPTGRDGAEEDQDGIAGNRLVSLGTALLNNESLADTSCANNPYYLDFHLASGDPFVNNNHIPVQCSFISSIVCEDKNGNGVQDEGEVFLAGIEVNLYNCHDTLNAIATTLSNTDGVYEFDGLPAGDYMVQFVPPTSHRFALDATPLGVIEQRGGFSECTTLTFGECDTTINMCLVPCPKVAITPSVQTLYYGQSITATASGGEHFKWTPNIEIDCDTCKTVRITPTESRTYTVTADDTYGCNNSAELKVNVLYNTARIYNPCECEFDNFFNSTGKFNEQIVVLSTIPNETWTLVENNGILSTTNSLVDLGTTFTSVEKEGIFYKYILDIKHQDGIGYNGKISNGKDSFTVGNICFTESSCRVIIPPTTPTGTPAPPTLGCVDIINASNTPAVSTLSNCTGCEFKSEGAEDEALYADNTPRNNVHTIHPSNQWQTVMTTFTHFDLATGDTLYVFDGPDTLSNLIGKYSGSGVSQTNGWVAASCQPSINPTGSLTFQFKTNGDRRKGTGWSAKNTCTADETTLTAPNDLQARLTCAETYKVFTINPATVTSNCSAIQDSQLVRIFDKHNGLCVDTILAYNKNFQDTFAIGEYSIEYKLKTDTAKTGQAVISVQGSNLVCNNKVTVPFGSGCSVALSPDDLLENPCDTITDTMYYHITLEYVNKKGEKQTVSGGGKNGQYPIISNEMLGECGGLINATIEQRYYEGLSLSFCNNGTKADKCTVEVAITDETKPWILEVAAIDTFVVCQIDLTEKGLGLPKPKAVDNCAEPTVDFNGATIISKGSEVCDTTKVAVEWLATDACGNSTTATQTVVFIRPSLDNLVKTKDETLSCDGTNTSIGETPGLQIGQWRNGQLIPSDTISLSTEKYICGYILQKTDVAIPATDCGKKLFRYWTILDWCDAESGPKAVDTTLVEFLDTNPPKFESNEAVITIELDHNSCTYDVNKIATPKAQDNCSIPLVKLDKVSRIENGSRWAITANEWAALANDSFELRWIAADICHEQLVNDTLTQILLLKDETKPTAICSDNIKLSLGQGNALLHYRDVDGGSYDACGIMTYEVSRDEVNWDSIVTFDCKDTYAVTSVYLRVTDINGNQSTCWMTVNVEDKISPICSDLPNRTETCDEGHIGSGLLATDTNGNGKMDDTEWMNMTSEQAVEFNMKYGNPNCSDNVACGTLVIEQQYQFIEKACGIATIKRRYRAIDWDGKGSTSNWATQTINIESKAAWIITLPVDWKGACGDKIPDSGVLITNGACDLMAYEVEEKVFTDTENACQKIIRTYTITNWCNYESGQPTVKIVREENIHGMVTTPKTITPTTIGAEFENIGKLEYIQILETKESAQSEMALVSGTIMDWKQHTVEEVQVTPIAIGANSNSMLTQADGLYNFELAMNNPYTIHPQKNEQPLNGVSTFDLVLISKHILGISEFNNPYQMIAADANKSGTITAFDMVQIRQLILNIKTKFTNNESWRFVDATYEFSTTQPLTENFSEVIEIANLEQDMQMDFVAVKVGDVNGNARTNSLAQAEDRTTTNTFEITTEDKVLKAGETYNLAFSTKQLHTILGYQFTLGYGDLKLEKLNSGVVGVENFGLHKMDDGLITTSWNKSVGGEQPSTLDPQPSTTLFNIKFTALKDGKLSEQLSLINRPTPIEAYDEDGNLMDIQLTFTTPLSDDKFELFQNQPNPFHHKTEIGFNLPGASEVQLILRDEMGRVLKTYKQEGTTGYNSIQIEKEDLTNGFIYYQLSTKYGTKAKKMLQLK